MSTDRPGGPAPGPMDPPVVLEVFADLWCPFTHVGLRLVVAERARAGRTDVLLRVRPWPLELVNGAPMRFAATERHARDLVDQVAPDLFAGLSAETFPVSTLEALAMVEAAYRVDPWLGESVSLSLRDALFEEGRDLGDPGVLAELADQLGAPLPQEQDRAAVGASLEEGRRRGVLGSPHFFCGERDAFCPSLDISRSADGVLHVERRTEGLRGFLDACWGIAPGAGS